MLTTSPVTWAALNTSTATRSSASAMRMYVSVSPAYRRRCRHTYQHAGSSTWSAKRDLLGVAVASGLIDRDQLVAVLAEIGLQEFVGLFIPAAVFVNHRDGMGDAHRFEMDNRALRAIHTPT